MRRPRAVVLLTVCLLALSGCSREIAGSAEGDRNPPLVEVTQDGFGILVGLDDAPVQLELFTEPQCTHCADLQADFGDQLAYYVGTGQLAVTYRPMTFLDGGAAEGHSARVVNAMFEAAEPAGPEEPIVTTGRQFQRFVGELWANQQPGGTGPSDREIGDLAREAGVPEPQSREIESGADEKTVDDLAEMEATNFGFLYEVDPLDTGTPTVFDLNSGEKLNLYDNDWLSDVMAS